jgi:alcohol dehydrogenase (cytochrome c)
MKSLHVAAVWMLGAALMFPARGPAADAAQAAAAQPAHVQAASVQSASSWSTVNLNYAGDRFADLAGIDTQNAGRLGEVCRVRVDSAGGFQSGLVLVDGLLYLTTRLAIVALDPTDCSVAWKSVYTPEGKEPLPNARGPAFGDGRIFRGTTDCRLLALDAKSGAPLWKVNPCNPALGETFAAAPIVWEGKVYIGIAGGDFGVRGRMFAFDAQTGRELWRFNTIPESGEFGADTWTGDSAKTGGGGTWSTYAIDPAAAELFVPVGNPGADFDAGPRAGTNLFTNSLVVLDANTGRLKWWYQLRARDDKDYDLGAAPMLFTLADGTPAIALGSKDGYLYVVNRRSHKLLFKTAVTTVLNQDRPVTTEPLRTCPSVLGGVEWNGPAYDALHKAIVVGAVDWCADIKKIDKPEYKPGELFMGGTFTLATDPPASGWITSVDPQTGKVKWRFHTAAPVVSGITPTAGGVVFAGDMAGNLYALNSADGTVLFKHPTGGAIAGGVITYQVGGAQYVAATSGNVSRLLWGETGLPSVVVYREGGTAAGTASEATAGQAAAALRGARMGDTDLGRGGKIFSSNCSACHGGAGEGMTGPSLKAIGRRLSQQELSAWIMNPVAARDAANGLVMPRLYPSALTEQDVFDVAAFVGTL